MARRNRRNPVVAEALVWILFFALLAPAGFVGWVIGHYTATGAARARTITISASSTATSSTAAPGTKPSTTTQPAAAVNAKAIFISNGCGACHTFAPAGTSGTIGPNLATAPARDAAKTHMPLAAFILESIVKPNAYIPPGYPRGVMPQTFGTTLTKAQLADLVAFIVSGKK